jgi:cyclic pyranopterin phosphate synthase
VAEFSHLDREGAARMVDVGEKAVVRRTATAAGRVRMSPETVSLLRERALPKGDALNTARIAVGEDEIDIVATARASDRTGVEMEALTAVSVAALTVYDMCKAVDKGMVIEEVRLLEKTKEPGAT